MRIICNYCNESRDSGDPGTDIAMYVSHLIKDHPEVIRKATQVVSVLSPDWNWQTQKVSRF